MIWRLNMRLKQKLAVTGICSLALITVAFETTRKVKLDSVNSPSQIFIANVGDSHVATL
jgi:hypothetical protein